MKLHAHGAFVKGGRELVSGEGLDAALLKKGTIAYSILQKHNQSGDEKKLKIRFDSLTSHDITYVGIIQTARASGLQAFPMPYVLTNCHNSLCAVGGTINEDDHAFALSAAKKYGGTYVPTNMAVIHSYNREEMTGCGRMILGSDSHTRYGALGTMAVGEGGGELAKQLLGRTWDLDLPEVTGVLLTGKPRRGVGPQDVAIAFIKAVFQSGFVKNRVVEFIGEGVRALPVEYRNGIDVMTTETTCLSSIWATDEAVRDYYRVHGREEDYKPMAPAELCYYDRLVELDLSEIEPMIALPFHPSNAYTLREFIANAKELLQGIEDEALRQYPGLKLPRLADKAGEQGVRADQAIVAGCAGGTYDNLCAVRSIMKGHTPGNDSFTFSVYPGSQPTNLAISRNGVSADLMESGVLVREAFCGPCFGAGDTPANGAFSIRHTTRNFINREGSKPGDGQLSFVALMDARSIAATARNGGILTPADEIDFDESIPPYQYDKELYQKRVFKAEKPDPDTELVMGPNIKDWPVMPRLKQHLLIKTASSLRDPVTTTDELIPSGETSSYRSNPLRLAEFTLSRRDPGYTGRAKAIDKDRLALDEGRAAQEILEALEAAAAAGAGDIGLHELTYGSGIYAVKPGDGSAREQAASCQRVLGGAANFAGEYATKRYRSNLINWGIFPFLSDKAIEEGDYVLVPDLRSGMEQGRGDFDAYIISGGRAVKTRLSLGAMTGDEKQILMDGCLINYYQNH